jgi:hypothetical protein
MGSVVVGCSDSSPSLSTARWEARRHSIGSRALCRTVVFFVPQHCPPHAFSECCELLVVDARGFMCVSWVGEKSAGCLWVGGALLLSSCLCACGLVFDVLYELLCGILVCRNRQAKGRRAVACSICVCDVLAQPHCCIFESPLPSKVVKGGRRRSTQSHR